MTNNSRRLAAIVAVAIAGIAPSGIVRADHVVDLHVWFEVENRNDTMIPCEGDDETYEVAGHLVGPASALAGSSLPAVTVYQHGSGNAQYWHFQHVPDYDHISHMAALSGHVSLSIDMVGYGDSGIPPGDSVCFGSEATVLHQVIQALRSGDYDAAHTLAPRFSRVAVAGHSGGGLIAEVEAYSFRDVDALILAGSHDVPVPRPFFAKAGLRFAEVCSRGGQSQRPGSPSGYAFVFSTDEDWDELFFDAEPEVVAAFASAYERDPCGASSLGQTLLVNQMMASTVTAPTLIVLGEEEPFITPGWVSGELQRARMVSSEVTVKVIPGTGHAIALEATRELSRSIMSDWLEDHGF